MQLAAAAVQFLQQPLRRDKIGCVEPLGEAVVHRTQCFKRFGGATLIAQQPGEAGCGAEFQ
jgi:hypothetical protein